MKGNNKQVKFWKMSGAGNDFIILDNRRGLFKKFQEDFIRRICNRKLSVGADGIGVIFKSKKADFKVKFFNSDGSLSRFCGNGSRCISRYAYLNGIAGKKMTFEGDDGIHAAWINREVVSISVPDVKKYQAGLKIHAGREFYQGTLIHVGVPHFVTETLNIGKIDVNKEGSLLRFHPKFSPGGANINFIQFKKDGSIRIRSYERGVEHETLACGSGCVAAALCAAMQKGFPSPILLTTRSSIPLHVHFQRVGLRWKNIFLEGDARIIFKGHLGSDALRGFDPLTTY